MATLNIICRKVIRRHLFLKELVTDKNSSQNKKEKISSSSPNIYQRETREEPFVMHLCRFQLYMKNIRLGVLFIVKEAIIFKFTNSNTEV